MRRLKLRSLFLLTLALFACLHAPARAQTQRRTAQGKALTWKLAFELAFAPEAPYAAKFPSLYEQPYAVNRRITKDVLDRVVRIALQESGARRLDLQYLPGGYLTFDVQPSAQLDARATEQQTRVALDVVGYLAQQTLVIASRRAADGDRAALLITQGSGGDLILPSVAQRFWRRLSEQEPSLNPGFSGTFERGRPGLYLVDTEGDWPSDNAKLDAAIAAVSKEFKFDTAVSHFRVQYLGLGNDWKQHPHGEEYLQRLTEQGRAGLARRLERIHRPRVERWIAQAFRRHAPGARPPRPAARNRARAIFPTHAHAPQRISIRATTAH